MRIEQLSSWQTSVSEDPWHVLKTEFSLSEGMALPQPDGRPLFPELALVIDEEAAPSLPSE